MDKRLIIILLSLILSLQLMAKDPTQPIITPSTNADIKDSLKKQVEQPLTAIITRNKKYLAIIEGNIYRIGEYYNDQRILNIFPDRVVLSSPQGNTQLSLIPNIKKQIPYEN